MPIRVKCKCGKTLAVKDALAGKAIKCPGCQEVIRIPAAKSSSGSSAAARSSKQGSGAKPAGGAAATAASGGLDDLFEEEGFGQRVGATCPACSAEMKPNAVFCTRCGFNVQTGERMEAHRTEAERTVFGHKSLDKAASDIKSERALQEKLQGTGFPWWLMAFILFLLASAAGVGVMAVDYALAEEGAATSFNPLKTFLWLAGVAFYGLAIGAGVMLIVRGFQESVVQGLLVCFVPFYVLYFVATRWSRTWRPFVLNVVAGGVAVACMIGAQLV